MADMLIKMTSVTLIYITLTVMIWIWVSNEKLSKTSKIVIGIIYGVCSILSTHFGISYQDMLLNVRDLGPLIAGLFFDPLSGLISGFIGGIERYIVGEYFGISSYTRVACGLSTCLAGVFAMFMKTYLFKEKKPSPAYAFFMGAVMEVFHMYTVLITHRNDLNMAFYVVDVCSIPMILFTAFGLAITSIIIIWLSHDGSNIFKPLPQEKTTISHRFQIRLFIVMFVVMLINIFGTFILQSQGAYQNVKVTLYQNMENITWSYNKGVLISNDMHIGSSGSYIIYNDDGEVISGTKFGEVLSQERVKYFDEQIAESYFEFKVGNEDYLCKIDRLNDGNRLLLMIPTREAFWYRNSQTYETVFAAILILAIVYILISLLVENVVVKDINSINKSLGEITKGNLDEEVKVKSSLEFASLSQGINQTVTALKGYIEDAKKRIEKELEFASIIQSSALPKNFIFPGHNEFELFAMMDAAKEVGGDFYDFFFAGKSKFALVIADVSGKGIPAALFMMKAKTAIRSFAQASISPKEILKHANASLCEGNDAEMFVTVWIAILDIETGEVTFANAGHEYPVIFRAGEEYELYKDVHSMPLAVVDDLNVKEYSFKLNHGDKIFVYTDGVPEAINRNNEQYGTDRLVKVLNEHKNEKPEGVLNAVRKDVEKFAGGVEQFDDITMLGFSYYDYYRKGNV